MDPTHESESYDSDENLEELAKTIPFGCLYSPEYDRKDTPPTNGVNGNELGERLESIELDQKDDANEIVPVTESILPANKVDNEDDDFEFVETVVSLLDIQFIRALFNVS